jgi:DNA-binding CsgD family transcriptional regulator
MFEVREEVLDSSDIPIAYISDQRSGPGILVLTATFQLLYMDRRAQELCGQINQEQNGKVDNGVLPKAVVELGAEILQILQVRTGAKDWEQFQVRRTTGDPKRPVILRGFGLPDRGGIQKSRIFIMMEGSGRWQETGLKQAMELFNLTDREQAVVQNLSRGWTNKEIATELRITEQTVKEHIKHIMQKTRTSTRTGILAQVLRLCDRGF